MFDNDTIPPQLYALFLRSLETAVKRIEECREQGDLESLSFHAHAIRGTCGAYGHDDLAALAGKIEDLADAGAGDRIGPEVDRFSACARPLLEASTP